MNDNELIIIKLTLQALLEEVKVIRELADDIKAERKAARESHYDRSQEASDVGIKITSSKYGIKKVNEKYRYE